MNRSQMSAVVAGVAVIAALALADSMYFTVQPFERGVVTRAGSFNTIAEPGFHIKVPALDVVTKIPVDTRQLRTPPLNTYTIDNQEVDATLVVQYQIPVGELQFVYTHVGQGLPDVEAKLQSMVTDRWKIEAGKVNVTEFANKRADLTRAVTTVVRQQAAALYHLQVLDVQLPNLDYQASFRQAQSQAAIIKTQIEQSQGLKIKAGIDADTARVRAQGEANQEIEAARGRAESELLLAQRHAQALVLEGDAQAKVIQAQGQANAAAAGAMADAVAKNPALVQLTQAQKWDGKLPVSIYSGAPIPFMPQGRP